MNEELQGDIDALQQENTQLKDTLQQATLHNQELLDNNQHLEKTAHDLQTLYDSTQQQLQDTTRQMAIMENQMLQ